MSTFSYSDYQQVVAQAQSNANGDGTKVGYFRLKDDGDIAIARINIGSPDEMSFASVHTLQSGGKWLKVSCHNPLGMNAGVCPLCAANAANPKGAVGKSSKKLFIPMLVSYRDPASATGYTAPAPVVWDRPASFSRELANKLMIAGDLRNTLVLITRNGKVGDMQTTYSMDILPESHPVFKPEMIPAEFGAFTNFNIARHSYWEKTIEEINAYLTTGQFPERIQTNNQQAPATNNVATVAPSYAGATFNTAAPAFNAPTTPVYSTAAPVSPTMTQVAQNPQVASMPTAATNVGMGNPGANTPARNFTGFSF